ncbi:hypothetical protein BSP4_03090 [Bacillus subtilis subsp. subtilis]|nr:Tail length tape measure protein [Bacillus subtilis]PLV36208.1 hypothetical protein BSP4_03090 [Bacillus subtilis subsp. subtilis]
MSMSRKETPDDNAFIESFHSSLKSKTLYLNSIERTSTIIVERNVKDYIYYNNIPYSNETKQPITDKLSAIGCLKGVLIPVSKTG